MQKNDQSEERTIALRSTRRPSTKKSLISNSNINSDTPKLNKTSVEILRRDILDKDQQISNLQSKITQINETYELIHKLIQDLESSTGIELLSYSQHNKFNSFTPTEAVNYIRQGISSLIKIHKDMPNRFEKDFTQRVNQITDEMEQIDNQILDIQKKRQKTDQINQNLTRTLQIEESEKESLHAIVNNLRTQIENSDHQRLLDTMKTQNDTADLQKKIRIYKEQKQQKSQKNEEQRLIATAPYSKRMKDTMKEDIELQEEISKLQQQLEREYQEHFQDEEELQHTENEIQRAKEVMMKFKMSHRKEEKIHADTVNRILRLFIDKQRDDSKWAIKNQMKKNRELERQKADLIEEEQMLSNYLQLVEKKLAAQMLKLPDLTLIQQRSDDAPKRRINVASKIRDTDDLEMRTIKRQMAKLQKDRIRARTAML